MGKAIAVKDVFGQKSSTNPRSYLERDVERRFRDALADDGVEAIVIYGTSKQGKSSLRRSVLPDDKCTYFSATSEVEREGLYRDILNQVGAVGRLTSSHTTQRERGLKLSLSPFKSFGGEASFSKGGSQEVTREDVEVDYHAAATAARLYADAAPGRPIVIDNFHHVGHALQKQLATDIRTFSERGVKLVVFGTWTAQNYLQRLNSDLQGRIRTLSIEPWLNDDLENVLKKGEKLLNIEFSKTVCDAIVQKSAGNVALLQQATLRYLESLGISARPFWRKRVTDLTLLSSVFQRIADELVVQTTDALRTVSRSGQPLKGGRTRMYWLLRAMLENQQITNVGGVRLGRIHEGARALLAKSGGAIESLTLPIAAKIIKHDLQHAQAGIQTPLLAYDDVTDSVFVLDAWTLFTLRRRRNEIAAAL